MFNERLSTCFVTRFQILTNFFSKILKAINENGWDKMKMSIYQLVYWLFVIPNFHYLIAHYALTKQETFYREHHPNYLLPRFWPVDTVLHVNIQGTNLYAYVLFIVTRYNFCDTLNFKTLGVFLAFLYTNKVYFCKIANPLQKTDKKRIPWRQKCLVRAIPSITKHGLKDFVPQFSVRVAIKTQKNCQFGVVQQTHE